MDNIARLYYTMIKSNIFTFEKVPDRWQPAVQALFDAELKREPNEVMVDTTI